MYKVKKYTVVDDFPAFERSINDFCKEGKYEIVGTVAYNRWSILVIYKEIINETKDKG